MDTFWTLKMPMLQRSKLWPVTDENNVNLKKLVRTILNIETNPVEMNRKSKKSIYEENRELQWCNDVYY